LLFTAPAVTPDGFADQLHDVVTTLLDKFAPLRTGVRRRPKSSSRWLSTEAVTPKRERRRLERRWLATRTEDNRQQYRRACRCANRLIIEHFRTRLQDCDNDPGKRWCIAKELLHTSDRDNTATNAENCDLCTTFSVFFLAKINTLKSSVAARLSGLRQSTKSPDPITPVFSIDSIPSVTNSEVLKLLSNFTDKSSPMDFVPTSLLNQADMTIHLPDGALTAKPTVRNLGVQLDSELSFDAQARNCVKSCYYHL